MRELRSILEARTAFAAEGNETVLITLVEVHGSSYRRPGARMVVGQDGRYTGFVSGGCLEGDLAEHARRVFGEGHPRTLRYDLSESDELAWGLGMGCPGTLRLLLEPFDEELASRLHSCMDEADPFVLGTVFEAGPGAEMRPGHRFRVGPAGAEGLSETDPLAKTIADAASSALREERSVTSSWGEEDGLIEALLEYLETPLNLIVVGAGPDARALVQLATDLGWLTTLVDRSIRGTAGEDLPADTRVVTDDPVAAVTEIAIDTRTAVVLMSHHYERDRALLKHLLDTPSPYIGLLGAASRRDALLADLDDGAGKPARERLYAPVGLDIGADSPVEIALSVASEIQAVIAGRPGGFLRERERPIHER
jgi:xanthine/CO dehydrogenase XdhC/CoxF family maturation factor